MAEQPVERHQKKHNGEKKQKCRIQETEKKKRPIELNKSIEFGKEWYTRVKLDLEAIYLVFLLFGFPAVTVRAADVEKSAFDWGVAPQITSKVIETVYLLL